MIEIARAILDMRRSAYGCGPTLALMEAGGSIHMLDPDGRATDTPPIAGYRVSCAGVTAEGRPNLGEAGRAWAREIMARASGQGLLL